ncbi:MAG: HAD-IA family hydrolase [Deltaproteobacteria bacterium]|nr:HAD-IA family hydrolase [Deltaproteobacteria bacterium]
MRKDLLIFDLDGTLIDSSADIAWAANKTLTHMGCKEETAEHIKKNIGWGVKVLLEKLMPHESPETITAAREKFLEIYSSHLVVDTYLYPEVRETILHFSEKGKKMAIVTNKPERLSIKILENFGLSKNFHMVVGGDTLPSRKPDPAPLVKVINDMRVEATRAVFIGDSPIDGETGKKAGVFTIGVPYGYRGDIKLSDIGFDLVVRDFKELQTVIE